jgi:hypothetical protein
LVLRDDGACIRCAASKAPRRSARPLILVAAVAGAAAIYLFVIKKPGHPTSNLAAMSSPYESGVSGFVKVDIVKEQWQQTSAAHPELAEQMLDAMVLHPGFLDPLAEVGAFEVHSDLDDVVFRTRKQDADAFAALDIPAIDGDLAPRRIGGHTVVGTEDALNELPPAEDWHPLNETLLSTLEDDAFIGIVCHARGELVMAVSLTPDGGFLTTARSLPATTDVRDDLVAEGIAVDVIIEFDTTAAGNERISMFGDPFVAGGIALAIFVPAIMKYVRNARSATGG